MGNGKTIFYARVPILQAFHGTTLSRNISITVPHNIEKRCKAYAIASAMPPRPAEKIWADFEATVDRIGAQLEQSKSSKS